MTVGDGWWMTADREGALCVLLVFALSVRAKKEGTTNDDMKSGKERAINGGCKKRKQRRVKTPHRKERTADTVCGAVPGK